MPTNIVWVLNNIKFYLQILAQARQFLCLILYVPVPVYILNFWIISQELDSLTISSWTQPDLGPMKETLPPGWSSVPVLRDLWVSSVSPVRGDTRETLPTVVPSPPVCPANVLDILTVATQIQVHVYRLWSPNCFAFL